MGNSPRARAQRKALVVTVHEGEFPPNYHRIMEEARLIKALPYDQHELAEMLIDEEYEFAPSIEPGKHGTFNAYTNWYCHCPLCTWANTERTWERRQDAKQDPDAPTE